MDDYVSYASALPPEGQLPTLIGIALVLGLGKGGVVCKTFKENT